MKFNNFALIPCSVTKEELKQLIKNIREMDVSAGYSEIINPIIRKAIYEHEEAFYEQNIDLISIPQYDLFIFF